MCRTNIFLGKDKEYVTIESLSKANAGQKVLIRARVHNSRLVGTWLAVLVLPTVLS